MRWMITACALNAVELSATRVTVTAVGDVQMWTVVGKHKRTKGRSVAALIAVVR